MQTRNNRGELIGETNTTVTQDGAVIITNTMYDNGRAVSQNISVRDGHGNVSSQNVFGKLLP
jgi:hypothetical protein